MIDKALAQAVRASDMIVRLRNFTRKSDAELRQERLDKIIEEAIALSLIGIKDRNLKIRVDVAADATWATIDKLQIQQVFPNLIRNAVEAMEPQPVKELWIASVQARAEMIAVSIPDNGPGLAPEVREKLFQPFVTTKDHGVGIGLSICRTIVEAHGGSLSAADNIPSGITFEFTLPAAEMTQLSEV